VYMLSVYVQNIRVYVLMYVCIFWYTNTFIRKVHHTNKYRLTYIFAHYERLSCILHITSADSLASVSIVVKIAAGSPFYSRRQQWCPAQWLYWQFLEIPLECRQCSSCLWCSAYTSRECVPPTLPWLPTPTNCRLSSMMSVVCCRCLNVGRCEK